MSLINEALKKAQRERSGTPSGAMPNTGDFDQRAAPPKRTQSLILIVGGAAALVVLSVGITVYLVSRPPVAAPSTPVVATPEPVAAVEPVAVAEPVAAAPIITLAIPAIEKASDQVPPAAVVTAAPVEAVPVAPARQPELHIQLFVDAIRVMGIRSSGGESKVLMNDRVYRVNDIVDRVLVLKLVKVEPEMLTFTDANGMVYTKSF